MKITLRQVEAFFWAGKLGSIHAAAYHLSLSQPAVSVRIKELEGVLGTQLFARDKHCVELTAEGRDALSYAERLLSAGRDFENLAMGSPSLGGVLRLGSDESTAMVALPDILSHLKREHPRLVVEITIDIGTVLQEKLHSRTLDIALHTTPSTSPHVVDEPLGWIGYNWVAGTGMPIPDGPFTPAIATKMQVVTNSHPSTLSTAVRNWLRGGGIDFDGVNSCNSLSLMLRLVKEGHAIAVFPLRHNRCPLVFR